MTKAGTPMTLPQPPDEPRTKAGRALVFDLMSSAKMLGPWGVAEAVNRIEAEARVTVLRDLRTAVEGLPGFRDPRYSGQYETIGIIHRAAVHAIIDAAGNEP